MTNEELIRCLPRRCAFSKFSDRCTRSGFCEKHFQFAAIQGLNAKGIQTRRDEVVYDHFIELMILKTIAGWIISLARPGATTREKNWTIDHVRQRQKYKP